MTRAKTWFDSNGTKSARSQCEALIFSGSAENPGTYADFVEIEQQSFRSATVSATSAWMRVRPGYSVHVGNVAVALPK